MIQPLPAQGRGGGTGLDRWCKEKTLVFQNRGKIGTDPENWMELAFYLCLKKVNSRVLDTCLKECSYVHQDQKMKIDPDAGPDNWL